MHESPQGIPKNASTGKHVIKDNSLKQRKRINEQKNWNSMASFKSTEFVGRPETINRLRIPSQSKLPAVSFFTVFPIA